MSQRAEADNPPGAPVTGERVTGDRVTGDRVHGVLLPDATLAGYRAAADDLVEEAMGLPSPSDTGAVADLVGKRLDEPGFTSVLSALPGGTDLAVMRIAGEVRTYQPSSRQSASTFPTFIKILLLSQVDSVWWAGSAAFASDAEVADSADLVDLGPLKAAGALEFRYRAQPAGLPGRVRDRALHRVLRNVRPRVAGLRFTRSRPVVIAAVNQVARDLAALQPAAGRPWVTSMVRSVAHQHRLRSLGYSAVLPSSHCSGYACDLEKTWFRQFDPGDALARVLHERQAAGQLNVIDEGHAWHLCVSPRACDDLRADYDASLRAR